MSSTVGTSINIINKLGLHARAAAKFVQTSMRYGSEIWVTHKDQRVNGKSIMGIMMLAASCGTTLEIEAIGEDAQDALNAIVGLISARFNESE